MNAASFIRAGAVELLRGIAWDMAIIYREKGLSANCKMLWDDAKRIEDRFKLKGFTSFELATLEFRAKFNLAVWKIQRINALFELTEIERVSRSSAQDDLRDIINTLGQAAMSERIGANSYQTATKLI